MSTTRSPTRPGPVTEAGSLPADRTHWREATLVLVAHGSPRCRTVPATLARHAAVLTERRLFADVRTVLLHGEPPAHGALADLRDRPVYVVPTLMCAGRNAMQELPRALGLHGEFAGSVPGILHLCPPLGLHPALAGLVAARAREALARNHWTSGQAGVLLVAHGSKASAASRRAAELQAARLRAQGPFRAVSTAFLEEQPFLPDALSAMPGPLVVVGLFATPGVHADRDVTRMLADSRRADVEYLGAIGADADIPDVIVEIVDAISRALPTAPQLAAADPLGADVFEPKRLPDERMLDR